MNDTLNLRYRPVNRSAAGLPRLPSGYIEAINCWDDNSPRLVLPVKLVEQLESERNAALQAQIDSAKSRGAAEEASGSKVRKPPAQPHSVGLDDLDRGWPPPAGNDWIQIWDPVALRRLIADHNDVMGSTDSVDRRRATVALTSQIKRGPWRRCAAPEDVESAIAALRLELGHVPELVSLVVDRLRMAHTENQPFSLPPILLTGDPGLGKTYAVQCLARLLGLPLSMLDMSVQQTNSRLHGADRHWSNATQGLLRELIVDGEVANPILLLDELDKVGQAAHHYDPIAPLHNALEPLTARNLEDNCMPGRFDGSRIGYIATTNQLSQIPISLLSRFHLILVRKPDAGQALQIARSVASKVIAHLRDFEPVGRHVITEIADRSAREIRVLLEQAAARAIASGRRRIDLKDLFPNHTSAARPLH